MTEPMPTAASPAADSKPAGPAQRPARGVRGAVMPELAPQRNRLAGVARLCHLAGAGAALAGMLLAALALGPGLRPGYLLSYDMVVVPSEPWSAALAGWHGAYPRAVPSDLLVALLSRPIPADLAEKLLIGSIFLLACTGVSALLADEHWIARVSAGICYAWNPYVAERLIIGQWALLLGYGGLPWVLAAVTRKEHRLWRWALRLALVMLPAAVGGFAAMCVTGLVLLPGSAAGRGLCARDRLRRLAVALAVACALSLPWLVPSLLTAVRASPAGISAFAARADTPFGALGSLLLLGGVWNSQAVPAGYGGPASVIWLAVVVLAVAVFVLRGRGRWPGIGLAAAGGLAVAGLGTFAAGQAWLRWLIAGWSGFGVLRDGQQFVAPLALAESLGAGLMVAWLLAVGRSATSRDVRWAGGILAMIVPIMLLPGLAWGAAGRLAPVQYPRAWLAAVPAIDRHAAGGKVLLLPWAAYRRFGWNGGEAMLDPWPRLLAVPVIWNDALQVGRMTVPAESPLAVRLTRAISSPGSLTPALLAAGVRVVLVDDEAGFRGPGHYPYQERLRGWAVHAFGSGLVVYEIGRHPPRLDGPR